MDDKTVKPINIGKDAKGRFVKGNPGGGRKPIPQEFRELAESFSVKALQTVIDIVNNPETETKDRIKAIEIIMDRGIGKPIQQIISENLNKNIEMTAEEAREIMEEYNKQHGIK